jgi:predicted nucleic acid-binding protein
VIVLDTSAIVGLADGTAAEHPNLVARIGAERGPRVVPAEILAETTYMLAARFGLGAMLKFLEGLTDGSLDLAGDTAGRLPRIVELLVRYADLRLDFADAAVVACAEAHGGRVLTLDRRDFDVIAREGQITVLP